MLLYMSAAAGILIAVVLLLRRVAPGLPQRCFVLFWNIVLARLLIPLTLPLPFGVRVYWVADAAAGAASGPGVWRWIWAAGAVTTAAVMAVLYRREWNQLRDALPPDERGRRRLESLGLSSGRIRILVSDRISTPVAAGFFRPRIVLPKAFITWDAQAVAFALQHERTHIARADNLQKLLMTAALCVHWFNPLVWIMRNRFDRDLEKSCDEKVIAAFGEASRCDYADTLVELAARKTCWSVCGNGFGTGAIHERIVSMMREPAGPAAVVAAAALMVCSLAVFLTAPLAVEAAPRPATEVSIAVNGIQLPTAVEYVAVLDAPEGEAFSATMVSAGSLDQVGIIVVPDPSLPGMASQ